MITLTSRELEVINLAKLGDENKQIALKLGIGIPSVKSHLKGIFNKLEVYNRTQAVYICLRDGVITFDRK